MKAEGYREQRLHKAKEGLAKLKLPGHVVQRLNSAVSSEKRSTGFCCFTSDPDELFVGIRKQSREEREDWFMRVVEGLQAPKEPELQTFKFQCDFRSRFHNQCNAEAIVEQGELRVGVASIDLRSYVVRIECGVLLLTTLYSGMNEIFITIGHGLISRVYSRLRTHWIAREVQAIRASYLKPFFVSEILAKDKDPTEKATDSPASSTPVLHPKKKQSKPPTTGQSILNLNSTLKKARDHITAYPDTSSMFKRMFPDVHLQQLDTGQGFMPLKNNYRLPAQYRQRDGVVRLKVETRWGKTHLFNELSQPSAYFKTTGSEKSQVYMLLSSDNSCLLKQKMSFVRVFRNEFELLYLRHCFTMRNRLYIVDKSIGEGSADQPNLLVIYQLAQQGQKCVLIVHSSLSGLGDTALQQQIQVGRLKGLAQLCASTPREPAPSPIFNLDCFAQIIAPNSLESLIMNQSEHSISLAEIELESPPQLTLAKNCGLGRRQDYEYRQYNPGFAVVDMDYLKKKWPVYSEVKVGAESSLASRGKYIFWEYDEEGWMIFTDQALMQKQRQVFSYVLASIGRNLLSGQSLTRISLPVTIFQRLSFLERIAKTFESSPQLLVPAASQKDPVKRFRKVVVYGLAMVMSFLVMQKPFNPILGETYQGSIGGLLYYAEQISHHPPITSYLLVGPNFRQYGTIQHRSSLGINSASGHNTGDNYIQFCDGSRLIFTTAAGEVGGMIAGKRKFRPVGSIQFLDLKNSLYCEIKFAEKGGLFSKGTGKMGSFKGQLLELDRTCCSLQEARKAKSIRSHGQFQGLISKKFYFNGQQEFDIESGSISELKGEDRPLPSDPLYRGDVFYLSREDERKAQSYKEILENIQRNDRKLREQLGPKTEH